MWSKDVHGFLVMVLKKPSLEPQLSQLRKQYVVAYALCVVQVNFSLMATDMKMTV